MSFLDLGLNNVPEIKYFGDGEEVELVVQEVEQKTSNNGNTYLNFRLEAAENGDEYDDIYFMQMLPKEDDTPKRKAKTVGRIVELCEAFNVEITDEGIDLEDFNGKTAYAILNYVEDEYGKKNVVKKWVG